ncbi:DUF4345 domain-containing protein [Kribbella sp. NPDC004536]|uniref:DUF4345 domain-containing protein n=1 Tax=Kribbella sp. NPDC004536 TaxID=3364106 RepID=UPI00368614F4
MVAIVVVAVFFAGMGLYGLVAPAALVRPFGQVADGANARGEVRAVYGGYGVAVAGLLTVAAFDDGIRRGAVIAVAVALAGMAAGRLAGCLAERPRGFYPNWFYFGVEVVLAAVLWVAA